MIMKQTKYILFLFLFSILLSSKFAYSDIQQGANIDTVLYSGCYAKENTNEIFRAAYSSGLIANNSITDQKIHENFVTATKGYQSLGNQTTYKKVTYPNTPVFRGFDGKESHRHVVGLKSGVLRSKASMAIEKEREKFENTRTLYSEDQFWEKHGPKIDDNTSEEVKLVMRLLSIKSSDTPKSQFVSVALDYDVAAGFGSVVYAFTVNPDSQILGISNCTMSSGVGAGEIQFQILDGTPIYNLHRKDRRKTNPSWEKYDAATKGWIAVQQPEIFKPGAGYTLTSPPAPAPAPQPEWKEEL